MKIWNVCILACSISPWALPFAVDVTPHAPAHTTQLSSVVLNNHPADPRERQLVVGGSTPQGTPALHGGGTFPT